MYNKINENIQISVCQTPGEQIPENSTQRIMISWPARPDGNRAPLSNGMGTSKKQNWNKIIMSHPDEKRRRQLTEPLGLYKELFDELRLNKDLHRRYKEDSRTHDRSRSPRPCTDSNNMDAPSALRITCVWRAVLSTLHILTHWSLLGTLQSSCTFYHGFTDEESKKQSS